MDVVPSNFLPGDPRLIDQIVYELKSQGIFDQFRKECIADVDTKPAYQNLRQRVEGNVTSFLAKQKWSEDLNKNQLREQLRKHICESVWLERGVERIVDQVVNPKINSIFLPKVEDVYHTFLGIEKPVKKEEVKEENSENNDDTNKPGSSSTANLLPQDLEAISPESNKDVNLMISEDKLSEPLNLNAESQSSSTNTTKTEDEESPPFEPLDEISDSSSKFSPKDDNSVDSQTSGPLGPYSSIEHKPPSPMDISQNSSDTKVSSNESIRMEICETTSEEVSLDNTEKTKKIEEKKEEKTQEKTVELKSKEPSEKNQKSDKSNKTKADENDKKHEERKSEKKSKHDKDGKEEKRSKDNSHSKDRSSSKHSHSSSKDKDKKDDKDRGEKDKKDNISDKKEEAKAKDSRHKDKEQSKDKEKSKEKSHRDKDSKSSKDKSDKDKSSKSSSDRSERSSKDKDSSRDKHKSSSSSRESDKNKEKEKIKDDKDKDRKDDRKDKESDKDKHKLSKEKSSSSSKDSHKDSKHKDSSKKHKDSSERSKDRENSSSKSEKHSKDNDKSKNKEEKSSKEKSKSGSGDHKNKKSSDDKHHRSSDKHKKGDRDKSSDHKKSSSSSKKDKDKKSKDDHYSSKDKRSERRSTDRDSNDGSGKMSRNSSFNEGNSHSGGVSKSSSNKLFDSSSSGDSSGGNSDSIEGHHSEAPLEYFETMDVFDHDMVEHEIVQHSNFSEELVIEHHHEDDLMVGEVEIGEIGLEIGSEMVEESVVEVEEAREEVEVVQQPPPIKFIKPKFASNMKEAMRIMKIRKQLAELEKQANSTLQNLTAKKEEVKEEDVKEKEEVASEVPIENGPSSENQVVCDIGVENLEAPSPPIKFIKPKFASNIQEAMRLMKIRKKLAKLEKEHQLALAELKKRKENPVQTEVGVEEVEVIAEELPDVKEPEEEPKIELPSEELFDLPIEEPLLQSFDLSSERFAELEARLALEMANIDFSSYDIPSDEEEEEYQSIVISPKKPKVEKTEDNKVSDKVIQPPETNKASTKPAKKSLDFKTEKKIQKGPQKRTLPAKVTKAPKLTKNKTKMPKSVTQKNSAKVTKVKTVTEKAIKKAKTKVNTVQNNLNANKKKLIIISCKQDLFNGFPVEDSLKSPKNKTPKSKETSSSEKENSHTETVDVQNTQAIKKNLNKELFVKVCNIDEEIREIERRKSQEIEVETSETKLDIEHVKPTLESGNHVRDITTSLDVETSTLKKVNVTERENIYTSAEESTTIPQEKNRMIGELWESHDTPCLYFLPHGEADERKLALLNDFITELENRIQRDAVMVPQVEVPKKKVGRKRKTEVIANNHDMNDVKRKRLDSIERKDDPVLNNDAQNQAFSLPLSPAESDVDVKKEEPLVVPTKRKSDRGLVMNEYIKAIYVDVDKFLTLASQEI